MTEVHPTALVSPKAEIGEGVKIGPFSVIEEDVVIGDETVVGAHSVIHSGTRIGKRNRVGEHVVLGGAPQHLSYKGERTFLIIGDDNVIREFVSIHRAFVEGKATVVGNRCYIMASSHVGHDCVIGDGVIITSFVGISGHVEIEERAIIGGHVGIHQFVRIGRLSIVSGSSGVAQDVPPFCLAAGRPAKVYGLNVVGLRRAGFSSEKRLAIKRAFDLFYRSKLPKKEALRRIEEEFDLEEIRHFVEFIRNSERGVCAFARKKG
ncbi:MAG: acyl-ACP--UDP-N-acetylglucosamine O-acyltransferase [Deferribacteres bacterium]|nr:acyl-ACP--UDP-N-acetylglucosamine O-acyltransferase [Deferribacteres bacterium]